MSRIPPALAYLVIYNPTLKPSPEDLAEGRDEDDVIEQAHVLFYTARERAVSRDRILRQVGLAKALANFAEMFTSQSGFDNVHAQKSRLVTISPEPNFWIHACVNVAKTLKATAKNTDGTDDFDYHNNSLNDEVLRTQMLHAFQAFKLQYGGFTHVMQTGGVRMLERQVEAFFTPWAWQWDVGTTPEFGNYLGLSVHPLKNQLSTPINDYISHAPDTPTLILSPPHIITGPNLPPISASHPLSRLLEPMIPPPAPKQQISPSSAITTSVGTSAPMHMLTASGNAVTKYITKPAAQVVDPRNWGWPTLPFGKGSTRARGKDRGKIPTTEDTKAEAKEPPVQSDTAISEPSHSSDLLGLPTDVETVSRASRSVSPSTIDHESLLDAQQDYIPTPATHAISTEVDAASIPLPPGSDSDLTSTSPHNGDDGNVDTEYATSTSVAPPVPVAFSSSGIHSRNESTHSSGFPRRDHGTGSGSPHLSALEHGYEPKATETTSESLQSTPLATMHIALPAEEQTPVMAVPELAPAQDQSLTQLEIEAASGSIHVWLDSPAIGGKEIAVKRRKVDWVAIPGLLVASILDEDNVQTWKDAAQRLLLSIDEIIQARQLTAAETTLRALNTTKVVAHYPASQLSASSSLPQFTSESPLLFSSARALQFATAPGIREIVTHTRWGTWCAARQPTIKTRVYMEVDRKDANLVDVDHELGSACRRWDETDA